MDTKEQCVSILCVKGSAFLHVMRGRAAGAGRPLSRFPEQDPIVKDQE
ncbi:hypothetical protein ACWEFD_31935 [Streptomyces ardesiacus]